jgi:hypothetical protein
MDCSKTQSTRAEKKPLQIDKSSTERGAVKVMNSALKFRDCCASHREAQLCSAFSPTRVRLPVLQILCDAGQDASEPLQLTSVSFDWRRIDCFAPRHVKRICTPDKIELFRPRQNIPRRAL